MITYLIRFVLCSALLLLLYYGLLKKEKMFVFNRFYLLLSIAFSLVAPLLVFHVVVPTIPIIDLQPQLQYAYPAAHETLQINIGTEPVNYWPAVIGTVYSLISILLLFRFIKNLYAIRTIIKSHTIVCYKNAKMVLLKEEILPYSFWKYIFVNEQDFRNNKIDQEILQHELCHVQQRHSLDILFCELLQVFLWFNPLIIFYRKALQLTHEYLADNNVVNAYDDLINYQHLLLQKSGLQQPSPLSSNFSYLTTKQRIIMMTKTTSRINACFRKLAVAPVIACALFLFSDKISAQITPVKSPVPRANQVQNKQQPVFQNAQEEIDTILAKYGIKKNTKYGHAIVITEEDKTRIKVLYQQLTETQKKELLIGFIYNKPLSKVSPTAKQFASFKDPKVYRVWIDEKKVSNDALNNYSANDFDQVFISKLYARAKKGKNYSYQVDLMTKSYYSTYYASAIKHKETMFYKWKPAPVVN